jgi:TPR repeat protein
MMRVFLILSFLTLSAPAAAGWATIIKSGLNAIADNKGIAIYQTAQAGSKAINKSTLSCSKEINAKMKGLEVSANKGSAKSAYDLGMAYINGDVIAKNKACAMRWIKKSMDTDDQDIHTLAKEAWIKHNLEKHVSVDTELNYK